MLKTDLYQLTMIGGYWAAGLNGEATFELSVRRLPDERAYLVVAGLEQALDILERVRFGGDDIAALRRLPQLAHLPSAWFDDYLPNMRFTGTVWAMPEGTVAFANEPLMRVQAPLPEAQLVETALLATLTFQTSVASKASRIVTAARGRGITDFGARRAHGLDAAFYAARAAFIGGCDGTSYVEAAVRMGIPTSGTMAHSWVQAFPSERDAFTAYSQTFPESAVYLLDTYDTIEAARMLVASGLRPASVRLDSGDLARLSRDVRDILDRGGLDKTTIIATSDLDEYRIRELLDAGAPIDSFGVGTALTTVIDAPALSGVYKLVELERAGTPLGVVKLSPGKPTWPGAKQVWRTMRQGRAAGDLVAAIDEPAPDDAVPLLTCVMREGRRLPSSESLKDLRNRRRVQVAALPDAVVRIVDPDPYPVEISDRLDARRSALAAKLSPLQ
jgi:nicotinate phosphoribosyltransferase